MKYKKITNDGDAFDFLMKEIYGHGGEFRIHTNKKGIRLFIEISRKDFTGYYISYVRRAQPWSDWDNVPEGKGHLREPYIYHRDDYCQEDMWYRVSMEAPSLHEALEHHINEFPGYVHLSENDDLFEDLLCNDINFCNYTIEFSGSLAEFRKFPEG